MLQNVTKDYIFGPPDRRGWGDVRRMERLKRFGTLLAKVEETTGGDARKGLSSSMTNVP
jgi:hypothetical protein